MNDGVQKTTYVSKDFFPKKYKNKNFSCEVDGKLYSVIVEQIWDFIMLPENEFLKLVHGDKILGLKKEIFIYLCVIFFKKYRIMDEYVFPKDIMERFYQLENSDIVDIEAINQLNETDVPFIDKVKINPKLRDVVLKDIPSGATDLEKAIYIYIKLCKILTYDDDYFAFSNREKFFSALQDIGYISSVSPDNPQVVCYVFSAIYGKLLMEMGIHHKLYDYVSSLYGMGHVNIMFRVGKFLVVADSTISVLNGDLTRAKLGQELNGLECYNTNQQTKVEFDEVLGRIYHYINEVEKKEKGKNIQDYLEEYRQLRDSTSEKISMEKKLKIVIEIVKNMKLEVIDQLSCIEYLVKKVVFSEEEVKKIQISYVVAELSNKGRAIPKTAVVFGLESPNGDIRYFLYTTDGLLKEVSIGWLQYQFDVGSIEYIDDEYLIPGIRDGQGKEGKGK